jgi:hypothetical protein
MAFLQHNERVKLVANAFDRASTGCFVTGIIAPTTAAMIDPSKVALGLLITVTVSWLLAGGVLHYEARRAIAALR